MNPLSTIESGARYLGKALLPHGAPVYVFKLEGADSDTQFLKRGLDTFARIKAEGGHFIPALPGVDRSNHEELAQEALEKSLANLVALQQGQLKAPPIVVVAIDQANKLAGIALSHLERHLGDEKRYTPLAQALNPHELTEANNSSLNWLVSLVPDGGVGKLLTAITANILPESVTRIDTVSELTEFTPAATRLAERMGFVAHPELIDHKPLTQTPPQDPTLVETFREIHGLPMTAQREVLAHNANTVLADLKYEPAQTSTQMPLDEIGFHHYSA
jgi:hypothetical protein